MAAARLFAWLSLLAPAATTAEAWDPPSFLTSAAPEIADVGRLVSAWVQADSKQRASSEGELTPWHDWSASPLHSFLPEPAPVVYHPSSGCHQKSAALVSPICYPSPKFIQSLLVDALANTSTKGVEHAQSECWTQCGSKQGACDFCGERGACCKQDFADAPASCGHGSIGCMFNHCCTRRAAPSIVLEIGSFLGETTVGLAHALARGGYDAVVVAMDTWDESTGFTGTFEYAHSFTPPADAVAAAAAQPEVLGRSGLLPRPALLFEQFVKNVNASVRGTRHDASKNVLPFPMLSSEAVARASALGAHFGRPPLIYLNPPQSEERMRSLLAAAWSLLACGGTLAGSGYHLPSVRPAVDAFQPGPPGGQPALQATVVHAPGTKWEDATTPYSDAWMHLNVHSNFSTWALRGKRCGEVHQKASAAHGDEVRRR